MRQRREGMPVVGMNMSKRPENILPIQSTVNLRILADINRIVEVNEVMSQSLPEDDPGNRDQPDANRDSQGSLGAHNFLQMPIVNGR